MRFLASLLIPTHSKSTFKETTWLRKTKNRMTTSTQTWGCSLWPLPLRNLPLQTKQTMLSSLKMSRRQKRLPLMKSHKQAVRGMSLPVKQRKMRRSRRSRLASSDALVERFVSGAKQRKPRTSPSRSATRKNKSACKLRHKPRRCRRRMLICSGSTQRYWRLLTQGRST